MESGIKKTIKKNACYYLTTTVVEWVDVFTRKRYKDVVVEALDYCIQNKGLNVYAYCLMTNHLHMVVSCDEPHELKDTIRDFKRHTVKTIIQLIKNEPESRRKWMLEIFQNESDQTTRNKTYKFWQVGNHAVELYNERFIWQKINYIHNNPVAENFVSEPEDWLYSSASNYILNKGILKNVCCLQPRLRTIS